MDSKRVSKRAYGLFLSVLFFSSGAFAQENLSRLVWATHNMGAAQQLLIDHYTNGDIEGLPGEDIEVAAPVANGRKVIVAVLDTGVDYSHPQLKNIIVGKGYNVINPAQDATDGHGHGTHISGIIAAQLDARGFQGVTQNALILPVKVVQTGPNAPIHPQDTEAGAGTALTENVAKGIVWAVQNGAEVINLSLAWPSSIRSKTVDAAMALAAQKNVVVVSSAGNDGTTANLYPCIYENVICVGSQSPDGTLSHFSNYGPMVDVLAPGIAIFSTWPMNKAPSTFQGGIGYEFRNGTSMSAPFVTGAIADLLSRGYGPDEARARLMLGTRPTSTNHLFTTSLEGIYSTDHSTELKVTRFGNIDLKRALALSPSPLILPKKKGFAEVDWDGVTEDVTVPITWINRWKNAGAATLIVAGEAFSFAGIAANETVVTPVKIHLGKNPEDILHLHASVDTDGFHKSDIEIIIQVIHTFTSTTLPANAIVKKISGLDPTAYSDIRSVVNVANLGASSIVGTSGLPAAPNSEQVGEASRADLLFLRDASSGGTELALVQDSTFAASAIFPNLKQNQFLSSYRLPDQTYVAIFTKPDPNAGNRPGIFFENFDSKFKFVSEVRLGTDITVLDEGFTWIPFKNTFCPLWISIGFTPPLDQPAYDPWNPTYRDTKMPRIFYMDGGNLRTVALGSDELPLQILLDGRVLIAKGSSYLQTYEALTLTDGKITRTDTLSFSEYRMFVGLDPGIAALNLLGASPTMLALSGSSSPGNLRVTGVGTGTPFDDVLSRSTVLDALVLVSGTYQDRNHAYYFVQTNYNLQFFTSGSNQTLSTTLNRYSYIPSMIAARDFYPTLVKNQNGGNLPAIYLPATPTTGNVSEIIAVDPNQNKLMRPAAFRLKVSDGSCFEMGNLIAPQGTEPAKQVFVCKDSVVQIPLMVAE